MNPKNLMRSLILFSLVAILFTSCMGTKRIDEAIQKLEEVKSEAQSMQDEIKENNENIMILAEDALSLTEDIDDEDLRLQLEEIIEQIYNQAQDESPTIYNIEEIINNTDEAISKMIEYFNN